MGHLYSAHILTTKEKAKEIAKLCTEERCAEYKIEGLHYTDSNMVEITIITGKKLNHAWTMLDLAELDDGTLCCIDGYARNYFYYSESPTEMASSPMWVVERESLGSGQDIAINEIIQSVERYKLLKLFLEGKTSIPNEETVAVEAFLSLTQDGFDKEIDSKSYWGYY